MKDIVARHAWFTVFVGLLLIPFLLALAACSYQTVSPQCSLLFELQFFSRDRMWGFLEDYAASNALSLRSATGQDKADILITASAPFVLELKSADSDGLVIQVSDLFDGRRFVFSFYNLGAEDFAKHIAAIQEGLPIHFPNGRFVDDGCK